MRLRVKTRHGPQLRDCLLRLVLPQTATLEGNESAEQIAAAADGGDGGWDGGRAIASSRTPALAAAAAVATRGYVNLDSKDSALAPGQFAAFYIGDECVGAGVMCGWSAAAAAAVGVAPEGEGSAPDVGLELGLGPPQEQQQQQQEEQLGGVLRQQGTAAAAAVG